MCGYHFRYTKSCDIWSIGVITYILLCGYPPFYGDTDTQIFESVRTARFEYPSPEWDGIRKHAKGFISLMLKRVPDQRPCAAEALAHPWIKELTEPREQHKKREGIVFAPRLTAFIKFRDMQKLQKHALAWLAANATNHDITSLKDIFDKIDVNNDGTITLQELDTCLENGEQPFFSSSLSSVASICYHLSLLPKWSS